MKYETEKSLVPSAARIAAYLDGLPPIGDRQATLAPDASAGEVNAFPLSSLGDDVRELQSQSQEELGALLPSVLDRAFKGEL